MKTQKITKRFYKLWKECRVTIFFILFVLVPAKSSLADWNWVPTGSMNPTILEGDLIFINKIAYDLRFPLTLHRLAKWSNPQRGDIVVCFSPDNETRLVKRVIGLPGDTIELRNNILFINGEQAGYTTIDPKHKEDLPGDLKEKSVLATEDLNGYSHVVMSVPSILAIRNFGPVTVPKESYFVLGDNRDQSKDSRYFGFVERKSIIGKAKGIITSFDITDKFQPRFKRFFSSLK